jgi:hypothetical protein
MGSGCRLSASSSASRSRDRGETGPDALARHAIANHAPGCSTGFESTPGPTPPIGRPSGRSVRNRRNPARASSRPGCEAGNPIAGPRAIGGHNPAGPAAGSIRNAGDQDTGQRAIGGCNPAGPASPSACGLRNEDASEGAGGRNPARPASRAVRDSSARSPTRAVGGPWSQNLRAASQTSRGRAG